MAWSEALFPKSIHTLFFRRYCNPLCTHPEKAETLKDKKSETPKTSKGEQQNSKNHSEKRRNR